MSVRFHVGRRLEPIRPVANLDRGFRAEVADPVWFLARQWQLAEHQGEDAASPIGVSFVATHDPIDPLDDDPDMDPRVVPAEAIVESSPEEWWTPGRRVRIGALGGPSLTAAQAADATLRVKGLPPPYDRFNGVAVDGLALYRRRVELGLPAAVFDGVPDIEPADLWDSAELVHTATFTSAGVELSLPRHDGGDVDWYSVSANDVMPAPQQQPDAVSVVPARLRFPAAPHPRWWQIENAHVDIGGFPPDRGHLATMLLIDLLVSHADDWFTFPIDTTVGSVVTLREVTVRDSFDDDTTLVTPATWTLFKVTGLDPTSLVVWPTAVTPLGSAATDEVVLGVDEDANLLWAVERRADGHELAPPVSDFVPPTPTGQVLATEAVSYEYHPSTALPPYWHPYEIHEVDGRRRFVQGRLADLEARPPVAQPAPVTSLLYDAHAPAAGPVHQIEPATIPTTGLRLERRWMLGRRTDGLPVLWAQRRRLPLLGPPVSGLRFDVLDEVPATTV